MFVFRQSINRIDPHEMIFYVFGSVEQRSVNIVVGPRRGQSWSKRVLELFTEMNNEFTQ